MRREATMIVLGASLLTCSGCLSRTLVITSEPEGAVVWVNDVEVGRTPLETEFTFYGDFDVRVRKEGYKPLITHKRAQTPIYEYPPIDFIVMAMPWRTNSRKKWHFELEPVDQTADDPAAEAVLLERADELRQSTAGGQSSR